MNKPLNPRDDPFDALIRCGFYPLAACTALGVLFLTMRMGFTRSIQHGHLLWNVILAWVPYVCSVVLLMLKQPRPAPRRSFLTSLVALMWLAFFPNAPYLVTDFVHLTPSASLAWWYDIGLIATFAWTGLMLAVVSLSIVQALVAQRYGQARGWAMATGTILLSGVGIYIGRFVRLNSWDPLVRPLRFGKLVWDAIARGSATSPRTLGVTIMFSAMLMVFYVTWRTARPVVVR